MSDEDESGGDAVRAADSKCAFSSGVCGTLNVRPIDAHAWSASLDVAAVEERAHAYGEEGSWHATRNGVVQSTTCQRPGCIPPVYAAAHLFPVAPDDSGCVALSGSPGAQDHK